jgi:hypothetical protein
MRDRPSAPSKKAVAPHGPERNAYLVLDDFGRIGYSWRETDQDGADRETLIRDLLAGQYNRPVRSSPSIPLKAGAETLPWRSPRRGYSEHGDVPESVLAFIEATWR